MRGSELLTNGISEKKAHVREPCGVRMGAEIDVLDGILSAPMAKMLQTGWLAIWIMSKPSLSMTLLGRLTRCFEFRRLLMGLLNLSWLKSMWCRPRKPSTASIFELVKAAGLLPLAAVPLRTPVSGLVACSDASTLGGGMCVSSGLTPLGKAVLTRLDTMSFDCQTFQPQGSVPSCVREGPRILVVSFFNGVGGVMCALGRLPCAVLGYEASEVDLNCLRLTRTRWPGIIELRDVTKIDGKVVEQLAASIGNRIDLVLLSAGSPCQDLSVLNVDRQGLRGTRSKLFFEIPRVRKLLQQCFSVRVELMFENVFSMSSQGVTMFNQELGVKPYLVDAKYFTWVRRPRLFWVTWPMPKDTETLPKDTETLIDHGLYFEWQFANVHGPRDSWLDEGST